MVQPAHVSRGLDDSDDEIDRSALEGLDLMDQIAEIETMEVRSKLGLSQKVAKPKGLKAVQPNLAISQKPIAPRALNTFAHNIVGKKEKEEKLSED